jgi:membrane-associated protease RseP (regulator of RpoE activity)
MIEGVSARLIFAVVFVTGLAALMWKDRKNVERHSILFIRRSEKGINLLDRIAKKAPRFWNIYAWIGVVAALITIPLMLFQMGWIANNMIQSPGSGQGAPTAILPGLTSEQTISGNIQPGVTFIPVEYWVISIAILMIVHEASHGIVARMEDFEINSVGWLVMGIIPGAFVEPKGEQMMPEEGEKEGSAMGLWDQGDWKGRLKVLAAGSWANYVTAAVIGGAFFLMTLFVLPNVYSDTLHYSAIQERPAAESGMSSGEILSVNGTNVSTFRELKSVLNGTSGGDNISVETTEGEFELTLDSVEGYSHGFMGVTRTYPPGVSWFVNLLSMAAFLNLAIGMFNLLPAKPLDGGHIIDTFVEEFGKESQRKYVNYFSLLLWVVVIGSLAAALIL